MAYSPPMIQTERKGQNVGSCAAMSPGVRRMPAPMMLPTVTARPKVRPRTFRRDLMGKVYSAEC
jgi:hypothetical protein